MEAVIFVGPQAAGKSTFYKERFFNTHLRINLDMLKTRYRENVLLRACIEMKQPFVVDNTNPTIEERTRYIEAARAAHFRTVGYFFQTSLADSLRRNGTRPEKERIPAKGVAGTYHRLQIPTFSEGFDGLYLVKIVETGGFMVEELRNEL